MITIFNRKEVRVTRRMEERFEICNLLESNGIPTATRTNSMTNLGRSRGIPELIPIMHTNTGFMHTEKIMKQLKVCS